MTNFYPMSSEQRKQVEQMGFWDLAAADDRPGFEVETCWVKAAEQTEYLDTPSPTVDVPKTSVTNPTLELKDPYANYLFKKYPDGLDELPNSNSMCSDLTLSSVYGHKTARNYQEFGIKFGLGFDGDQLKSSLNRSVRVCIADQMRLGKTPQGLLIVKNLLATKQVKKILIVVKSANIWQWVEEHKEWVTNLPNGIWPITGGVKGFIPPGFTSYIISMDTLRVLEERLINEKFDLIIADEAHSFKNRSSSRSISLDHIIDQTPVPHIIFLTGTPVLNRADEYFTILHHLDRKSFPSEHQYRSEWLEQDAKGKYTRIQRRKVDGFRAKIAPYVIRREKEDVYSDLPEFNIIYTVVKIEEESLKKLYNKELDKMNEKIAENGGTASYNSISDSLMVLRRICGMAKIQPTLDYITEFIEESEDEKIAIGIHHKDVRETLKLKIPKGYGVVTLSGEDSAARKFDIQNRVMKQHENRVLVINSLAGGVGMDFHYINNFLVTERQWNGAMESQFEFRFYNPDKSIKKASTFGEYMIAKGTIDEFWHNMVLEKRKIFNEVMDSWEGVEGNELDLKHLIEETMDNRL